MVVKAAKGRRCWTRPAQRPQVLRSATLAVPLLLTFIATGWEESRAAGSAEEGAAQPADCLDVTPHEVTFVTVEPGVQLEVLDFGGSGETMVLLTGLGDNAHVWDGFAYQFTDDFRVIGITRRGFGRSDQPEAGYDVRTRARDDIKVLDRFGIGKAVFVGHSLAGSELSELGLAYPDRVDKLVYLDAADLAERFVFPEEPPGPSYADDAARSLPIYQAASGRLEGFRRPNAAACNAFTFMPSGMIGDNVTPPSISEKLLADVKKQPPVNWQKIAAPRLAIFATFTREDLLPWYWYLSADQQAVFDRAWPPIVQWHVDTIERFRGHAPDHPAPIVRELPGAPHYIYISNEAFVVREMREFLLSDVRD
ncbi:MAG TPA: alpha/beta hydrolase [Geminicoccaceae bacterium]|nr:alpha/beta hydrolase [Geminicoccaceae bacterium]